MNLSRFEMVFILKLAMPIYDLIENDLIEIWQTHFPDRLISVLSGIYVYMYAYMYLHMYTYSKI